MIGLITGAMSLLKYVPEVVDAFTSKNEKPARALLGIASKVVADKLGSNPGFSRTNNMIIQEIEGNPELQLELHKAVMADKHKFDEMALENTKDARNMQNTALQQDDIFSKRFVYYLASFWSVSSVMYIFAVSFLEIPEANTRLVDTITGFLMGTIISAIIQYFFGSSLGSKIKNSWKKIKND